MRLQRRDFLLGATVGIGLAATPLRANSQPLKIVCTTAMIADAARVIGGTEVEITTLMGPGIDPHSYAAAMFAGKESVGDDN